MVERLTLVDPADRGLVPRSSALQFRTITVSDIAVSARLAVQPTAMVNLKSCVLGRAADAHTISGVARLIVIVACCKLRGNDKGQFHSAYYPQGHITLSRVHNNVRIRLESGEDSANHALSGEYGAEIPHIHYLAKLEDPLKHI